jgi:uncharacterized protein
MRPTAQDLIRYLKLEPLSFEGGYFRQTYRSAESIPASALPARYGTDRPFGTAIFYLLTNEPDSFSALHQLTTDEIYHFYLGDPVEMLLLHPDKRSERVILGHDVLGVQKVQVVAPAGSWQGSRLIRGGEFALMGTTMAPGFDFADWTEGKRDDISKQYPEQKNFIAALTRS